MAEMTRNYADIMKECATAVMAGLDAVQCNRSKTCWTVDNGFFVTYLDIESVKAWGIRIRVAMQFFWSQYDFCCYQFYNGHSHIYPSVTDEIHLPEVPMNAAALLEYDAHPIADFERYFMMLMQAARKKMEEYNRMRDLALLRKALAERADVRCDGNKRYDLDLAIVSMTAGDEDTALAIVRDALCNSQSPDIVHEADELLAHMESREEWLSYVNRRVEKGRTLLCAKLKWSKKSKFAFE